MQHHIERLIVFHFQLEVIVGKGRRTAGNVAVLLKQRFRAYTSPASESHCWKPLIAPHASKPIMRLKPVLQQLFLSQVFLTIKRQKWHSWWTVFRMREMKREPVKAKTMHHQYRIGFYPRCVSRQRFLDRLETSQKLFVIK
jgi:hypothetical protein